MNDVKFQSPVAHFNGMNAAFAGWSSHPEARAAAARGDYAYLVVTKGPMHKETGSGSLTYSNNEVIQLHSGERLEPTHGRSARQTMTALKWSASIGGALVIVALLAYLVDEHWFRNRLVNPYGYGGFGGYGGY